MTRTSDITGQRFGKWLAITRAGFRRSGGRNRATWICRCDCGTEAQVMAQSLKSGLSRSCGCERERLLLERITRHGMSHTNLHRRWRGMRARCAPNGHPQYGGRGIRVCAEWGDFATFARWASAAGYAPDLEIDRIDVNGHYEPGNCRWIPRRVNRCNRQDSHQVETESGMVSLAELCLSKNMNPETAWRRITRQGMTFDEALAKPAYRFRRHHNQGRCLHGHEMTEENTYRRPGGRGAACRECQRECNRRAKAKRRATAITTRTKP